MPTSAGPLPRSASTSSQVKRYLRVGTVALRQPHHRARRRQPQHRARVGARGRDQAAIVEPHIGQEALVALDQRAAQEGCGKAHGRQGMPAGVREGKTLCCAASHGRHRAVRMLPVMASRTCRGAANVVRRHDRHRQQVGFGAFAACRSSSFLHGRLGHRMTAASWAGRRGASLIRSVLKRCVGPAHRCRAPRAAACASTPTATRARSG